MASTITAPTIHQTEGQTTLPPQNTSYLANLASGYDLKAYLAQGVVKYGGNYYELYKVIECESSWNPNAKNKNSTASGVAQFLDSTFKYECKGEKNDPYAQIDCMIRMFNEGKKRQWECFRMLYN